MKDYRTTDLAKCATQKFFEDQGLNPAVSEYFNGACVQQKVAEGYENYQNLLSEARNSAPEEVEHIAEKVASKLSISKEAFNQKTFDCFKEKFCEVMLPAAAYIPIKGLLEKLLKDQEDENLLMLVMSAIDDIVENVANRFANIAGLLIEGFPMELAESIADDAGDAKVIPVGIEIRCCGDDDDSEYDDGENDEDEYDNDGAAHEYHHPHHCGGECGGRCDCEEKERCEKEGCCQC